MSSGLVDSVSLFQPLRVGMCDLQHRVALAPLTRFRADDAHIPTDLQVEYYRQRASVPGTLLVTEGTFIAPKAGGYPNIPGIWNDAQVAGWKKVHISPQYPAEADSAFTGRRCCARKWLLHLLPALGFGPCGICAGSGKRDAGRRGRVQR